ncbi:hypothetical protein H0H87_002647, partial [Tephrocybe sp. NHM501043]
MFLSEFDFQLDYAPGKSNPANPASRCSDFKPKEGDDVLHTQIKALLTTYHTKRLFPSDFAPQTTSTTINSLSTFTINNSKLLEEFKNAYHTDTKWRDALKTGNEDFTLQDNLVFYQGRLYVPPSLCAKIVHSRHDSVLSPLTISIAITLGLDSI